MAEAKREKPKRDEYVVCETCSDEQGREVLVHRKHIVHVAADFLGEEDQDLCPAGHPLTIPKSGS